MRRVVLAVIGLGLLVGACCWLGQSSSSSAAVAPEPMIAHNVYFSLKDGTPANRQKLVDACKKYLAKHPGTVFFAAGPLTEELNRPVNDRDFDVGLHIVFKDKASHDKYQDADLHLKFIEENKDGWKKVRVFDSSVTQ
jgi:hypothetical protein